MSLLSMRELEHLRQHIWAAANTAETERERAIRLLILACVEGEIAESEAGDTTRTPAVSLGERQRSTGARPRPRAPQPTGTWLVRS